MDGQPSVYSFLTAPPEADGLHILRGVSIFLSNKREKFNNPYLNFFNIKNKTITKPSIYIYK